MWKLLRSSAVHCFYCWLRENLTDSKLEIVEGVFVNNVQLPHQGKSKLHHSPNVHVLPVMLLENSSKCHVNIPFSR